MADTGDGLLTGRIMRTWIESRGRRKLLFATLAAFLAKSLIAFVPGQALAQPAAGYKQRSRPHFDHSPTIAGTVASPQAEPACPAKWTQRT